MACLELWNAVLLTAYRLLQAGWCGEVVHWLCDVVGGMSHQSWYSQAYLCSLTLDFCCERVPNICSSNDRSLFNVRPFSNLAVRHLVR